MKQYNNTYDQHYKNPSKEYFPLITLTSPDKHNLNNINDQHHKNNNPSNH